MSSNESEQTKSSERILTWLLHLIAFCGLFLVLMVISHSVIAQETIAKDLINKNQSKHQVMIAVFEDHPLQVASSAPYGLSWKLIEAAAKTQNLDLIKIETTWQSAINRLKSDRLDLVFAAFKSKEREEWAQFTLPLGSDSSALFSAIDSPTTRIEDVDFEHETVGVISNSTQEQLAGEIGFKHIYPAKVRKRLSNLLEKGRVQYLLLGHSSISMYCKTAQPCVQQVGVPLTVNFTHVMGLKTSSKASESIALLNAGLLKLHADTATRQLFLEHGYSESYYQNWHNTVEIQKLKM